MFFFVIDQALNFGSNILQLIYMKKIILFYILYLPLFVSSQEITVTFPDDFDLQENPEYDNWTYGQNTFFDPLSIVFLMILYH